LRKENDDADQQHDHAETWQRPEDDSMLLRRVHDSNQEGGDGEFGKTKGSYTKRKPQYGIQDGVLFLLQVEHVEVSPVAVPDGFNGDADAAPLADLARPSKNLEG
jgi:hypothetical protein